MTPPELADRRAAALAERVPGYGGYADAGRRDADERAVRAETVRRLEVARAALAALQRRLAAGARFALLPAIESLFPRIEWLAGRLESAAGRPAAWLTRRDLDPGARAALVALDQRLLSGAEAFAEAAGGMGVPTDSASLDATLAALGARLDGLRTIADERAATLSAGAPPAAPAAPGLDALIEGEALVIAGEPFTVAGRIAWERGDAAVVVRDAAAAARGRPAELRLWRVPGGRPVLLERRERAIPAPPPPELTVEGEAFRLAWADAGTALRHSGAGTRRESAPRWVYAGEAGGWLWVEQAPDGDRVWRGLAVDASEIRVL